MKLRILEMEETLVRFDKAIKTIETKIKDYLRTHKNLTDNDYTLGHNSRFIILNVQDNTFKFIIDKTETHEEHKNKILNASNLDKFDGELTYFYDKAKNKHYLLQDNDVVFEIVNVRFTTKSELQKYNRTLFSNGLEDLVTVGDKSFSDVMKIIKPKV